MVKPRLVLILGANGFIGSHLTDRLIDSGYTVRAFGRFENEPFFKKQSGVEVFKGDFLNQHDLEDALQGATYVVHLVSTTTPATSDKDPQIDIGTNIIGSVSLFQQCVKYGKIKRVVFASSGGTVYGENHLDRPFRETDLTQPVSPYGIGKLTIENYLEYFKRSFGLDYTVLRVSNPYGIKQRNTKKQGVIPIMIKRVLENKPITVFGDGTMVRDYIYINDVVDVISQSLAKKLRYQTYNLGAGVGTSINELVRIIASKTNKKPAIEYTASPATFIHTSVLDCTRIKKEIDYTVTKIEDGIDMTVNNFLSR